MSPQLMSMSSVMRSYSGVLVASLSDGDGLAAEDRAAAGGEADHVGAAGDLPGRRDRVVAGRVHEDEALGRDRLGVVETSTRLVVPPLATAPSDFSKIVVRPPALLPGEGLLSISPPLRAV